MGTSGSHTLVIVWLFVPPQTLHFSKIYVINKSKWQWGSIKYMTVCRYSAVPFNLPRVNMGTSGSPTLVIVWLFVPPQTSHFSKIYVINNNKWQWGSIKYMTIRRYRAVPFDLPRVNMGTSGSPTLVIVWLFVPTQTVHFCKKCVWVINKWQWYKYITRGSIKYMTIGRYSAVPFNIPVTWGLLGVMLYLSCDMWFPTMWHFDKCRLRRACTASF